MKYLVTVVLLLTLLNLLSASIENTSFSGEPGCKTDEEVGRDYANFFDSTRYWRCLTKNVRAMPRRCPNGYGFQASQRKCVPYSIWMWELTVMPPSCPDFEQECIPSSETVKSNTN